MMYALLAFAAIFLVVGLMRVVEFKSAGINSFRRKVLIPIHVIGVLAFTGVIVLMAIDDHQQYKPLMTRLFFGSVLLLFPVHIYVNIKRRILVKNQQS